MIRLFFLLPLLMCALWSIYLYAKGYSLKDGMKGFQKIFIFNAVIIAFFVLMIVITDYP